MGDQTLSFSEALTAFNRALGKDGIKDALLQMEESVMVRGVTNEEMLSVVDLIDVELENDRISLCYKLIHLLVPSEDVNGPVLIALMGGFPQLNNRCKVAVLKWFILVKDMLTPDALVAMRSMYDIFFYYLDYGSLLPFVCRILHRLTKRSDVTQFRSRKIYRLFQNAAESGVDVPDLLMLADLYEQLSPGSLAVPDGKFRRNENRFFSAPDTKWRDAIIRVNTSSELVVQNTKESLAANPFVTKRKASSKLQLQKKRARTVLPVVSNKENVAGANEVVLTEMRKVGDVASALMEKDLVLPDRCSSVLNDNLFQHAFCLMPTEESTTRIKNNLAHMLEDEFFSTANAAINSALNPELVDKSTTVERRASDYDTQGFLLASLCRFANFMQETPPEAEVFLFKYLQTWNGVHHLESVTTLISLLAPRSFADLHMNVLQPISLVFCTSVPEKMARLAICLCELVKHWTVLDWESHYEGRDIVGVFSSISGDVDYLSVVQELVHFIDRMLLTALVQEDDHPMLLHAALYLYEDVVDFNTKRALPFLVPPSSAMAYRLLLSAQSFAISAICRVLAQYRSAYHTLQQSMVTLAGKGFQRSAIFQSGIDKVADYNQIVSDFCNALWLNRTLPVASTPQGSVGFCDERTAQRLANDRNVKTMRPALSITKSVAFAGMFLSFRETLQSQSSNEFRGSGEKAKYLQYLSRELSDAGLQQFLNTFIPASVAE